MKNIIVHTKNGTAFTFNGMNGVLALTQFNSGDMIHAIDNNSHETYIPYHAVILVEVYDAPTTPSYANDELCVE